MRENGIVPLRPLTLGELLDAAVALLRTHARTFLVVALVLAAAEQALLYPLREAAAMEPPFYLPYEDRLGLFWLTLAIGLGTEPFIIAILGGLTSGAAGPAFLGRPMPAAALRRGFLRRLPAIGLLAALAGAVAAVAALAGLLPWVFFYGLTALFVPVLMIDRRGPGGAIGRGLTLAFRHGMRVVWIRFIGYLGWLAIRLAMGFGGVALLTLAVPATEGWTTWVSLAVWTVGNAVAYTTLACLDAVLHLDTRMRTEALDLSIGRQQHLGHTPSLAVL